MMVLAVFVISFHSAVVQVGSALSFHVNRYLTILSLSVSEVSLLTVFIIFPSFFSLLVASAISNAFAAFATSTGSRY